LLRLKVAFSPPGGVLIRVPLSSPPPLPPPLLASNVAFNRALPPTPLASNNLPPPTGELTISLHSNLLKVALSLISSAGDSLSKVVLAAVAAGAGRLAVEKVPLRRWGVLEGGGPVKVALNAVSQSGVSKSIVRFRGPLKSGSTGYRYGYTIRYGTVLKYSKGVPIPVTCLARDITFKVML
jgi:hypothetical protein